MALQYGVLLLYQVINMIAYILDYFFGCFFGCYGGYIENGKFICGRCHKILNKKQNYTKKTRFMNVLSLFSGIGGIDVALSSWVRQVYHAFKILSGL